MYPGYRRTFWAKYSVAKDGTESLACFGREMLKQLVVSMAQIYVDEATERWVAEKLSFGHLVIEHLPIVIDCYMSNDVAVG